MDWQLGVKGYLEISLTGTNPERVINMAMSRGINVWDIRHDARSASLQTRWLQALRYLVREAVVVFALKGSRSALCSTE